MTMNRFSNPKWWSPEHDTAWERTKAAFKRDWEQTKHDLGKKTPDLNQGVKDTVKQAAGKETIPPAGQPNYEVNEPAYRFGHGARSYYGKQHPKWNPELEGRLKQDWNDTYPARANQWDNDRDAIRYAWDYSGKL